MKLLAGLIISSLLLNSIHFSTPEVTTEATVYAGSTPGDSLVKKMLGIEPAMSVDFIRWKLELKEQAVPASYTLNIMYGTSQPNTKGFTSNARKAEYAGTFTVRKGKAGNIQGDIYTLQLNNKKQLSFIRVNEQLFHLLSPNQRLMVGNAGWNYLLSLTSVAASSLPALLPESPYVFNQRTTSDTFDGRTPCTAIAREQNLMVAQDCFKLKWRLILNRDPVHFLPTTYTIRRTNSRQTDLTGKWSLVKGLPAAPGASVVRLEPKDGAPSIFFLVADDRILYFLDNQFHLFPGNEDFSYALNRID